MAMTIAVAGKGGTGKTTVSALLIRGVSRTSNLLVQEIRRQFESRGIDTIATYGSNGIMVVATIVSLLPIAVPGGA